MAKIYFDLDDVSADFSGYVNRALGTNYHVGETLRLADWEELRRSHGRLFRDLDIIEGTWNVIQLLESSQKLHEIAFLTALPFDGQHPWQYAPQDKIEWVQKNFPDTPCFLGPYAHNKYFHCKPGDILVDDKLSNCEEWESAGGVAHLFKTPEVLLDFLNDNLGENMGESLNFILER